MNTLQDRDFSFYVNCHTATHKIITPWIVYKPPFELSAKEQNVYAKVKNWVNENTEYEPHAPKGTYSSGDVMDWCFKEFRIPSFTFELLSTDYEPYFGKGRHDHLVHWMKTGLPVFLYLLVNIENLQQWNTPDVNPPLPEGVPPPPLG